MEQENYNEYLEQIENELQEANRVNRRLNNAQLSMFGGVQDENLIRWQLDLKEELDRIYHLLKGHQLKEDEKGNTYYAEPDDDNLKPFNEFGTQLIMNVLSFYLNRNTILSHFDSKMIEDKTYDFGIEVTSLIFCRYEEMMMTTTLEKEYLKLFGKEYVREDATPLELDQVNLNLVRHLEGKQRMFMMIVRELKDTVHASLRRALNGGERKELRTARTVSQSDNAQFQNQMHYPVVQQQTRQRRLLNPTTWF